MSCVPGCLVCERAAHLPREARECLHRFAKGWNQHTFGGWAGFVVSMLGAAWADGRIVGRAERAGGDRVRTCRESD